MPSRSALRVLIVDDEPMARRILRQQLRRLRDVAVAAEAAGVVEALELVERLDPDLVLLDVSMPMRTGFDLLPALAGRRARVVFVSGSPEHAVQAFEVLAVDYLLKPVRPERLALAVERARRQVAAATESRPALPARPAAPELVLKGDREVRAVAIADVVYVKALGNYTQVHLRVGAPIVMRRSMEGWTALLGPAGFARVHRSLLVNLAHLRAVRVISRELAEVKLEGARAPLAVGRKASLLLRRHLRMAVAGAPAGGVTNPGSDQRGPTPDEPRSERSVA